MRAAKLKLALVVASYGVAALAGVASVVAWSGADTPVLTAEPAPIAAAPAPPEPPIEGNWLSEEVPTAFPNIKPLDLKNADPDSKVRLAKQYPRLFAEGALAIQPADDTYRRLLKARLHQGAREVVRRQVLIERGAFLPSEFPIGIAVLEDMRATALELWPRDEKELIPRLEEFVGLAKDFTQFIQARVKAGTDPVRHMNMAERHRLKAEADLWKALHPK